MSFADGSDARAGFTLFALIGAGVVLGFLTLSVLFVVPIVVAVVVMVVRPNVLEVFGRAGLAGASLVLVYVAYVQHRGPGTVCWQTGHGVGLGEDDVDPWPWLVVGVGAGRRRDPHARQPDTPNPPRRLARSLIGGVSRWFRLRRARRGGQR